MVSLLQLAKFQQMLSLLCIVLLRPQSWSNVAYCVLQVKMPFKNCKEPIPDELYRQACVYTTEEALASCQKIGYPAMIKASWGGGGKGIRKV